MPIIDVHRTWAKVEERLATETDPVLRRNLETVLDHMKAEARGDIDGLLVTLSDDVAYHAYGTDDPTLNPAGKDGVRTFYENFVASGATRLQLDIDRLVVDRDCVVTEGVMRMAYPGRTLAFRRHRGRRPRRALPVRGAHGDVLADGRGRPRASARTPTPVATASPGSPSARSTWPTSSSWTDVVARTGHDEVGEDLGGVGEGDEVAGPGHRDQPSGRDARASSAPHAAGTRWSSSPCHTVTAPGTSSGAKPHGRTHARYSSTMPSPCASATAAACAMPRSASASSAAASSGGASRSLRWPHAAGR